METTKTKNYGIKLPALLILILALIRLFVAYNKEHERVGVASAMQALSENRRQAEKQAILVIDSLIKKQGRIFLYTNDALVNAGFLPNIPRSYTPVADIYGLPGYEIKESYNYEEFIDKYDSLGFELVLYSDYEELTSQLTQAIGLRDSVPKKQLYFIGYDSKSDISNTSREAVYKDAAIQKIHPNLQETGFATPWAVSFDDASKLTADSVGNKFFITARKLMKKLDGFYFYMVGLEKDNHHPGLDSLSFTKSVEVVNQALKQSGIDTKHFRIKVFPEPG